MLERVATLEGLGSGKRPDAGLPRIVDCAKKAFSKARYPPNVLTTRWLHASSVAQKNKFELIERKI